MIRLLIVGAVIIAIALIILIAYRMTLNKQRQRDRIDQISRRLALATDQLNVATAELKTIRDTGSEHTLNATLALEEIDRLREAHYAELESSK